MLQGAHASARHHRVLAPVVTIFVRVLAIIILRSHPSRYHLALAALQVQGRSKPCVQGVYALPQGFDKDVFCLLGATKKPVASLFDLL